MDLGQQWAQFLNEFEWNYFITCRTPYKIKTMTVRNWVSKLIINSNKVERVFYVSERDKGDFNNLHVHMLVGTKSNMSYQELRYGLGYISVGDYQLIYDSNEICKYITKHIGKNVDYDIVLKVN